MNKQKISKLEILYTDDMDTTFPALSVYVDDTGEALSLIRMAEANLNSEGDGNYLQASEATREFITQSVINFFIDRLCNDVYPSQMTLPGRFYTYRLTKV